MKKGFKKESRKHKVLKEKAKLWLLGVGVDRVDVEVMFRSGEQYNRGSVIADVVGYRGDVIVVVECGGSKREKLVILSEHVAEIYILPYGQIKPFRWSVLKDVCHLCGHRV